MFGPVPAHPVVGPIQNWTSSAHTLPEATPVERNRAHTLKSETCHEMTLDEAYKADFCCNRCRISSPVDLEGSRGQVRAPEGRKSRISGPRGVRRIPCWMSLRADDSTAHRWGRCRFEVAAGPPPSARGAGTSCRRQRRSPQTCHEMTLGKKPFFNRPALDVHQVGRGTPHPPNLI